MRPDDRLAGRLWDIVRYARLIQEAVGEATFDAYAADANLRHATERRLEIIGEAARSIGSAFREKHPEIPWRKIVALRNVLIHEYGEVKDIRIFRIVQQEVPALIRAIEPLVPHPPADGAT